MLSRENNDLLTRVEAGAPMGELFRQYWLPVLFDWELAEPDGAPLRVRLLGEDLIAFRASDGNPGLVAENCPHRGASLFFGRNEEQGLRCVYHGWKFDPTGACVDMPNEPPESNFKHKVRVKAYPFVEKGGVLWAYMGTESPPPPLPGFEWMDLPAEHRIGSKRVQETNWLQGMEGDIDQSHVSFTHSFLDPEDAANMGRGRVAMIRHLDRHPKFEVIDTDYGVCVGSGRTASDTEKYWRVTQYLMPNHTMTGPYGDDPMLNWRAWVPIDDVNVFVIGMNFHPLRALTEEELERFRTRSGVWTITPHMRKPATSQAFGAWRVLPNLDNDFFIDREIQKTKTYSGISEFWAQDAGPQYGMGVVCDRTREHLGTSDLGIISTRRRIMSAMKDFRENGVAPPGSHEPDAYKQRPAAVIIPAGESWFEATREHRAARPGVNLPAV
jgi:phenylpropionate dioxygenase-like ring-hydroxylating dioxygenase large terminal subunit